MTGNAHRFDRRAFLQSASSVATIGIPETTPAAEDDLPLVPTTPEGIRAAFADVPRLDDPTPRQRLVASGWYPDVVVPDEGPIPDPSAGRIDVEVVTPPWVLASVVADDRFGPHRATVINGLLARQCVHEHYVTPDGRDAVDVLLERLEEGVR